MNYFRNSVFPKNHTTRITVYLLYLTKSPYFTKIGIPGSSISRLETSPGLLHNVEKSHSPVVHIVSKGGMVGTVIWFTT